MRKHDKIVKASSFTALAWTWFTFWEGWLFGHFLGWWWAVAWCGGWLASRALYEWGRKAGTDDGPPRAENRDAVQPTKGMGSS